MKELGKFHHVGYLVKNIEKSIQTFQTIGFKIDKPMVFDHIRKATICFLNGNGTMVELIEPTSESDIYPLLKKYVNMPYHICYVVENINVTVELLKEQGFLLFNGPEKAPAISKDAEVVFLMHNRIGMIELLQENIND